MLKRLLNFILRSGLWLIAWPILAPWFLWKRNWRKTALVWTGILILFSAVVANAPLPDEPETVGRAEVIALRTIAATPTDVATETPTVPSATSTPLPTEAPTPPPTATSIATSAITPTAVPLPNVPLSYSFDGEDGWPELTVRLERVDLWPVLPDGKQPRISIHSLAMIGIRQ